MILFVRFTGDIFFEGSPLPTTNRCYASPVILLVIYPFEAFIDRVSNAFTDVSDKFSRRTKVSNEFTSM